MEEQQIEGKRGDKEMKEKEKKWIEKKEENRCKRKECE